MDDCLSQAHVSVSASKHEVTEGHKVTKRKVKQPLCAHQRTFTHFKLLDFFSFFFK